MNNLTKPKQKNTRLFIVFLFLLLLFFCENLIAKNKIGMYFSTPSSGIETALNNVDFTIPNPILGTTVFTVSNMSNSTNTDIDEDKLTENLNNDNLWGYIEKSAESYTPISISDTSYTQQECATKNPQPILLQAGIAGITGSNVLWTQLPPPLSDVALPNFPNNNPNFTINVAPPQGSAVGKYVFMVGTTSSSKRDTVVLLINNPPSAPTLTNNIYKDTNYVCHINGKNDTLYGLSMRNDPASTIGKGSWSQTSKNSSAKIDIFNILTSKPDTMGSINLIIKDNNVSTSVGTDAAIYDLKWTITSGACTPTSKTIVFVVANNQVTGVAKIENKPPDGIRWLCGNSTYRDTTLKVIGGYNGNGVWTQIKTPPYNNTPVSFIKNATIDTLFTVEGLPVVSNKPDTMKFAFVWNITLAGSKCKQTSEDTIKFYIVSAPPAIPNIPNIPICGNVGSTVSTLVIAPTPLFGQGSWTISPPSPPPPPPNINITNLPPVSAIVDNISSPSTATVKWELKNAQCPLVNSQNVNIIVTDGVKAQVKERIKYVCNDNYTLTITNNKITKAVVSLNVEANAIIAGATAKWTVAPSSDGILTIPTGTENNATINPTLTIQGNSLAKDSTVYKLYWTTNNTQCGTTMDSTIIIAFPPLSDSIAGGYNHCLVGIPNNSLSTTLFGPYISGKSGKWIQDTLKKTIGNMSFNNNVVVITNTPTTKSDSVKVFDLKVPTDTNINGYGIMRFVPATHSCPQRSKTDTIRVYQQASTAQLVGLDTVSFCTLTNITDSIKAYKPLVGQGYWSFVSRSNTVSPFTYTFNDTTINFNISAGDSCIYRFRWTTKRSTLCGDLIGSTKDVYIVVASGSSSGADAKITHIGSNTKQDTNWLCQVRNIQLTNKTYSVGKGSWRVISGPNALGVTFTPVSGATNTKVNVTNFSLPVKNDTSKYLIEFSVSNGVCATTRDTIRIFIINNPSPAQLSAIPTNPQTLCDITNLPNPPDDSTVIIPSVGKGIWTSKDSFPGRAPNLGIDTIKWTWKVFNRCGADSIKRIYIIANNAQGNAAITNKPFGIGKDTLIFCLPVNKDTTLIFNGNSPAPGFGKWNYFLNGPLTFAPSDSTEVSVKGFSGDDSVRTYGLFWSIFKAVFCPASYDTAYIKIFRKPEKPIFKPDTAVCVRPNLPPGTDSAILSISPTNNYKFGKFEWTIVRNKLSHPDSAYMYIVPPSQSQKTVKVVIKNTNTLKDSFTYILRLKVSGGGGCDGNSTDYKITVYPRILNKDAFGYKNYTLPDPGSKIVRVCEEPFQSQFVFLANKTLKPYQQGTWRIESPSRGAYLANRSTSHTKDTTNITNMTLPSGQAVAQYTTTFSITNKNINDPACGIKDTVLIYLIKSGSTTSPGKLQTSDSVCYGTTGKQIELRDPVGAIRLDWETRPHTTPASSWTTFIPNTTNLFYDVPEIITENDYRVNVTFFIPGATGTGTVDIGTCPKSTVSTAYSDILTIRLKNKDKFRLGKIDPTSREVCAESMIQLKTTYKDSASELNGHSITKWQTYQINAYDISRNKVTVNNPWTNQSVTTFDYSQTAPPRSVMIFYRAWIKGVDVNGCDFVTDTAVVYVKPKPKMSGSPFPVCADNNFNFKFDSATEGGYDRFNYPTPFTTAIQKITWGLTNTTSHSNTGMTTTSGILSGFNQPISYMGINNDTIPLVDTVEASATGIMGCESSVKTITFKVYPKARAELLNQLPLVNCPSIRIDTFLKLKEYQTVNSSYSWNVKEYIGGGTGVWTTNGIFAPQIQTNYAQNLAIQLVASSLYKDSATGKPCPTAILKDTLFSFGRITPNITITPAVCYGLPFSFTNTSSVNTMQRLNDTLTYKWWDRNDSLVSTNITPTNPFIPINIYPYLDSIYTIKYEIRNRCYSETGNSNVRIKSIPKAELKVNIDSFCSGTTIKIWKENELGNNPNSYKNEWIFGDGKSFSTNTYQNGIGSNNPILHQYDSISYAVDTLIQIISNDCGQDTQIHLIKILPVPKPNINLSFKDTICGSGNKYAVLDKTFFGGKEPVSTSWYINDLLIDKKDGLHAINDTLLSDTLWHSFAQYVDKNYPDQVRKISIKLLVTPTLGCAADSTSFIWVGSTAQPELFVDTIQPCSPAAFNIRATAAAGINSYNWYKNNDTIRSNSSVIPNLSLNSGTNRIKVVVSSNKQVCPIDSAFSTLIVYGYPQSQFELDNPTPYCYSPFPAEYKSTAKDADAKMMPITHWYWTIDSIQSSASYPQNREGKNLFYTYPLGGKYKTKHWVKDTRGTFNCASDTIIRDYEIFGSTISNFVLVDTTCATYTVSLTNKSTLGYGSSLIDSSYWIMGDGTIKGLKEDASTNHIYKKGQEYFVSLLTRGNKSCRFDTLTQKIVVRGFPKANFGTISPCSGNYTFFNNTSVPGFADGILGYKWTFEDGENSNVKNPSKLYDISNTYRATLTANGLFCPLKSDTTISFFISPAPTPIRYPVLYVGENVRFDLIAPSDNNSYVWLDKNKAPVDLENPKSQIVQSILPAQITDTFYLRSTLGDCIVDNVQIVQALPKLDVLAPTGFTPNDDGVNDVFIPKYIGINKLNHFQIFDRFGQLLFSTNDIKQSWDGRFRGKPLPTATYIWVVSAINDKGEPVNTSGGITLIRDQGLGQRSQ